MWTSAYRWAHCACQEAFGMVAECRLYLYSIMASNCLEKGSELLFGHCANISSEWKLPKGGSHYQKQQSAKNRFDVGIVLHYYLKNLSCCKPCPQCNMSYILAFFSVFSTSVCPCYRVHGRCSAGKKNYSLWRSLNFAKCFDLPPFWAAFAATMVSHYAHQITEGTVFKEEI